MTETASIRDTGTRLLLAGRVRAAAAVLARAVQVAPHDAEARHNLALALRALGARDAARMQAEAAVVISPAPASQALLGSLLLLTPLNGSPDFWKSTDECPNLALRRRCLR